MRTEETISQRVRDSAGRQPGKAEDDPCSCAAAARKRNSGKDRKGIAPGFCSCSCGVVDSTA